MGITVVPLDQGMEPQVRLDRKLWLNADRTQVIEDSNPVSPEAAFLYGSAGTLVPRTEAARLGALPKELVKEPIKREPVKQTPKPNDKMAPKPEDK